MPTMSRTTAMKMIGLAAFEEANFLTRSPNPDPSFTGAVFLPDDLRVLEERADLPEVLFFAPLEELAERDLEVFAIISRCSLSP